MTLQGKKILLGISGGIAAYKSCELLRSLQKAGAELRVAMTPSATEFVGAMTFASLSGFVGGGTKTPALIFDLKSWS